MFKALLQPIKAKVAGQGGRRHTLAYFSFDSEGQAGVKLVCQKGGCDCNAFFTVEELIKLGEDLRGKEDGESTNNGKSRAA